jgi:hypothetical protein
MPFIEGTSLVGHGIEEALEEGRIADDEDARIHPINVLSDDEVLVRIEGELVFDLDVMVHDEGIGVT